MANNADPYAAKRASARERYGRPFAIEHRVPRRTPRSPTLQALDARTGAAHAPEIAPPGMCGATRAR